MADLRVVQEGERPPGSRNRRQLKRRNPGKLNQAVQDQIVQMIRAGNYFSVACRAAGVSISAATDWMMTGETGGPLKPRPIYRRFAEAVREAEAAAEAHAVLIVRKAINEGDARAAMEYLRRRHSERWGDRGQIQVDGRLEVTARATPAELAAFSGEGEVIVDAEVYEQLEEPTKEAHPQRRLPAQDVDIVEEALQDEAHSEAAEASSESAVERHTTDAGED